MNKFLMQKSPEPGACHRPSSMSFLAIALLALLAGGAIAQSPQDDEESDKTKPWQELALELPAAPDAKALLYFEITPNTSQRFHIDPKALTVGADGVVRYTLVAQSSNGASNISYEGIRCKT
ncbi:MAG: CNP1-like family protein, partial [Oxalobacteraceae bacterium]